MKREYRVLGRQLVVGLFLACSALSSQAFAAGNPAAEALFERGRSFMAEQKYAEACAAFEASQELEVGIGTLLYLGSCYEKQNKVATAWATFREAQALAASRQDDREELALQRIKALEPRISHIVLNVRDDNRVDGLEVKIDRQKIPAGVWGASIPIDAGKRVVEITAPGRKPHRAEITIASDGETFDFQIPLLEPLPKSAPASAEPVHTPSNVVSDRPLNRGGTQRTVGWSMGGVGLAALVAGSVLGIQAKRKNDDSKAECPREVELCSPKGVALRDDARGYAVGSNIAFAVGGGLLATGFVLLLTAPSNTNSTALTLRPSALGTGADMSLRGAF
jgi:hypothetical protein